MAGEKRNSDGERQAMKDAIVEAVTKPGWMAIDVGEVLVSIGSAMMKGGGASEGEYLEYARKIWQLQKPKPKGEHPS